ncbi:glycerophosphodiester phosphodiesterase GDPD4 isoform X3 [Cajanus cajan]|uniref:glycerophosphodiester phosphodiesterase GDPD4 isoform X3 n=1 Tax=Cajanus cajan TaxID=3821 RepID=UPI00098D92CD|nr:glycerophosphodiester phosphodiesterase GDPD4 isoform X3 [Cajanus cajan]
MHLRRRCNTKAAVGSPFLLSSAPTVAIPPRLLPTPWRRISTLFSLVSTALRSMCLVLQTEFCLLSMTGRDLQRLTGNASSKVGYMSSKEIRELSASRQSTSKFNNESILTIQDALMLTANSVRQIILDVKVGPPFYEKELAKDVISVVEKTECSNCLIWAKSDNLARDVIKLSSEITVGYIVMREPSTGARTNLLRMKGAEVVGVYHPLIDGKLMRVLHRRNKKVYAWTVDDVESMQNVLFEHVDAIVTSNPTSLQRLMQDIRTQCLEEGYSLPR